MIRKIWQGFLLTLCVSCKHCVLEGAGGGVYIVSMQSVSQCWGRNCVNQSQIQTDLLQQHTNTFLSIINKYVAQ